VTESAAECVGQIFAEEARKPSMDGFVGTTGGELGEPEGAKRGEGVGEQPLEEGKRGWHAEIEKAGEVGDTTWGKVDIAVSGSVCGAGNSDELMVDVKVADEAEDGGALGSESAWAALDEDAVVVVDDDEL